MYSNIYVAYCNCFENNKLGQLALLINIALRKLGPGKPIAVKAFHINTMKVMELKLTPSEVEDIKLGGKTIRAYKTQVVIAGQPIGNFWITPDGKLVRDVEKNGRLIIELKL